MLRHQRLRPILDITQAQQDLAARELARLMQQQEAARRQLEQLLGYLTEYEQRQTGQTTMLNLPLLENTQAFLVKLNDAIDQQREKLTQIERRVRQQIEHWQQIKTRTDALEKIIQNYQLADRTARERRDQREQDDLVGGGRGSGDTPSS
ncbi:MAG: flagellar export protein FliJ [Thiotrichales bacterium]